MGSSARRWWIGLLLACALYLVWIGPRDWIPHDDGALAHAAERIAQGNATLVEHAVKGYQGDAGYMPPKGGRADLTDDEVSAAVAYMVGESQ